MGTPRQTPARAWIYSNVDPGEASPAVLAAELGASGVAAQFLPAGHDSAVAALRKALGGGTAAGSRLLAFLDLAEPGSRVINEFCVSSRLPLLILTFAGGLPQIGPAVLPGQSPCAACFESHARHFPAWARPGIPAAAPPSWPTWEARVAREARGFLAGDDAGALSGGRVLRFDPGRGEVRSCRIFKNPTCTVCSTFALYPMEDWGGAGGLAPSP